MSEWQAIETAPKDDPVLTFRGVGLMAVAEKIEHPADWTKPTHRQRVIWCCTDGVELLNVTHWMPLPAPPTVDEGKADPARFTPLDEGKAIGSARNLPSTSFPESQEPRR